MRKLLKEFRDFAVKGDALSMAVGLMIGGGFSSIVSSVVNDLFMPVVGLITGGVDFSNLFLSLNGQHYDTLEQAKTTGAPILAYGSFLTAVLDFVLLALCVFLFVKLINVVKERAVKPAPAEPAKAPRLCPYCYGEIHEKATRCCHCAASLIPQEDEVA